MVFGLCLAGLCSAWSQTTYYVDNVNGSDGLTGRSPAQAWATIARVNRQRFSPGDQILFRRSRVWREQLTVPSSGAAGQPITFGAYGTGANPMINGADRLVTGWIRHSARIWKHPCTPNRDFPPRKLFFNGFFAGEKAATLSGLTAPESWCWPADTLYVYAESDPGGLFTDPGIEAPVRYAIVLAGHSYITIDGIDCVRCAAGAIWCSQDSAHNLTVRNLTLADNGMSGMYSDADSTIVQNVTTHHNGISRLDHGLYLDGVGMLVEYCTAYSNAGSGFSIKDNNHQEPGSSVLRYNRSSFNGSLHGGGGVSPGGFGIDIQVHPGQKVEAYYNILHDNLFTGIWVGWCTGGVVRIWNNVIARTTANGIGFLGDTNHPQTRIELRNNIFFENRGEDVVVRGFVDPYFLDYDLYASAGREPVARWGTELFGHDQLDRFVRAAGQEHHGLVGDPAFTDAGRSVFTLSDLSSCVDRGSDVGLRHDFAGQPVPQGAAPDIGAFEWRPSTASGR